MKFTILCVLFIFGYVYAEDCTGNNASTCKVITCHAGYTVRCINNVCSCTKLFFKPCQSVADCTGLCKDDPYLAKEHCFDGICVCAHQ